MTYFDKVFQEIYHNYVLDGMDPDEAEVLAQDEAEEAVLEYRQDMLEDK